MAVGGLFALLDDIASTLDDVASASKFTAKLDDVSANTKNVRDIHHRRGLSVIWKVAKGSLRNKAIIIPSALGLSIVMPGLLFPLKLFCAGFLCFEGAERILHAIHPERKHQQKEEVKLAENTTLEAQKVIEKEKIKKAIRTDFILSTEVAIVTLATIATAPLLVKAAVLSTIGIGMTVGIYGIVGAFIQLDNMGVDAAHTKGGGIFAKAGRTLGRAVHKVAPEIIKTLSIVGTGAMLAVGGGILAQAIPGVEYGLDAFANMTSSSALLQQAVATIATMGAGVAAGGALIPAKKALEKPYGWLLGYVKNISQQVSDLLPYRMQDKPVASPIAPEVIPQREQPAVSKTQSVPSSQADKVAAIFEENKNLGAIFQENATKSQEGGLELRLLYKSAALPPGYFLRTAKSYANKPCFKV